MARRRLFGSERNLFRRQLMCGCPWVECHYCGTHLTQNTVTLDHVRPLSRKGARGISNIVPACDICNKRKASKTYQDFVKSIAA